jgi:hypothetical protein
MLFEFIRLGDPNGQRKARSHAVKHACRKRRVREAETSGRKSKGRGGALYGGGGLDEASQYETLLDWHVGSQLSRPSPPKAERSAEAALAASESDPTEEEAGRWDSNEPSAETLVVTQRDGSGPETPKPLPAMGGFGEGIISRLSRTDQYLLKWCKSRP